MPVSLQRLLSDWLFTIYRSSMVDRRCRAEAQRHFHADMVSGAERLKKEIGYNPTRFMQMIGSLGGVETARRLLRGRDASDGFTTLWEHDRLELSVEAFVLLPWYRRMFTEGQLGTAERRLREHRFDVDRFMRWAAESWPEWASPECGSQHEDQ